MPRPFTVGLISDTHGLLRPEAVERLAGSDLVVHAGDIGDASVLEGLARIAPVKAVRGNVDRGEWASALPTDEVAEVGGVHLYVLHELGALDLDPTAAGFAAVISGHSHQPLMREKDGVLYVNPGSAGPRRFKLPVTVGRLTIADGRVTAEIVELGCPAPLREREI
jgi:putative phosphoesterase